MRRWPELRSFACIGLATLLALAGCAPTLKLDAKRTPSYTLEKGADSHLKALLAAHIPPGESGFHPLPGGQRRSPPG